MGWQPPPRPTWVTRLNDHGVHVGGAERLVGLDREELLATACAQTGLHDFGDELPGDDPDAGGWQTHFAAFMDALDQNHSLHVVGRMLTRTDILRALVNRLELVELWRREPQTLDRPVSEPLIVIGAARSGTSILHELLSLDPAHLSPTTWKVHRPVAAVSGDLATIAEARRSADSVVTFWHDVQPEYATMHLNGGDLPTECIFLTVPTFLSDNWAGTHPVPAYDMHLATADHTDAYRWHRRTLQTLQQSETGRRWVLKAPSHLSTLRALFAVYPGARVIQLHRDPARTLPSMFDLMGTLKWMRTDAVDLDPLVGSATGGIAYLQRRAIADRAGGRLPDGQFHDLRYADLLADPVGSVRAAYEHFAWDVPDGMDSAILDYLAAKPKGSKGRHRYDLATFGLTAVGVRREFAEYLDRFDIPHED